MQVGSEDFTVDLAIDESDEREYRQDLFRKAYFDAVTGLPNGAVFEQSIAAILEDGSARFALAFIDLDRFRHVNDYFGRLVGDAVLASVVTRIGDQLRDSDLLARLSGNLFVLLLSLADDEAAASNRLNAICQRLKEPFSVDGQEVFTSATIGVSVYPDDGESFAALSTNAECAMRDARLDAAGAVRFYDRSMMRAVDDRNRAEQRLRVAIKDRSVACAYQPKVDLLTGEVVGVEALMRWRDENGDFQPPGKLLGLATELGLIDDIANMVLDETIRSIDLINDSFGADSSISINVTARQAGNEQFMRDFVDRLDATGFARRVIVEVTEEAFMAKDVFQRRILPMIREIGSKVSIDDFGTGYSSLSALADITADEVKIDRSFIDSVHLRPRSQNVLKAVEALGHSLGMTIVVEGVETIDELEYLRANTRIHLAQGFYFSPALLLEEVASGAISGQRVRLPTRPAFQGRR